MPRGEYHAFHVGDTVRSRYAAPWRGEVIAVVRRPKYQNRRQGDLVTCRVLIDRRGNPLRKPLVRTLDEAWLEHDRC